MDTRTTRSACRPVERATPVSPIPVAAIIAILTAAALVLAGPPGPSSIWEPDPAHSDEFDGNTLDGGKWLDYHPYWSGRSPSRYHTDNVSVRDGNLCLRSGVANANMQGDWVSAACVTSRDRDCLYGYYYEARFKASRLSMTSSFWFQGSGREIDVTESTGASVDAPELDWIMQFNTHTGGRSNDVTTLKYYEMSSRSSDDYHTYAMWWRNPRSIWVYCDNEKRGEVDLSADFDGSQYMFFDTETFSYLGMPTLESLYDESANTMYVDWVRTWKFLGDEDDVAVERQGARPIPTESLTPMRSLAGSPPPLFTLAGRLVPSHRVSPDAAGRARPNASGMFVVRGAGGCTEALMRR
ncbi:MAG: family 16 glycosylhydrolase [Chitinivibrionales bacterium]|nr:family 16 glycosylhydrolase [Chitinivibrionales bacterium]